MIKKIIQVIVIHRTSSTRTNSNSHSSESGSGRCSHSGSGTSNSGSGTGRGSGSHSGSEHAGTGDDESGRVDASQRIMIEAKLLHSTLNNTFKNDILSKCSIDNLNSGLYFDKATIIKNVFKNTQYESTFNKLFHNRLKQIETEIENLRGQTIYLINQAMVCKEIRDANVASLLTRSIAKHGGIGGLNRLFDTVEHDFDIYIIQNGDSDEFETNLLQILFLLHESAQNKKYSVYQKLS